MLARHGNLEVSSIDVDNKKRVSENFQKPFMGRIFFLDLKGYNETQSLSRKLELAGAVVEEFFSKDIQYIISNRLQIQAKSSIVHADYNLLPEKVFLPSSVYDKKQLLSQADNIIAKVISSNGTCDILEKAKKWGIIIWPLDKALNLIEKYGSSSEIKNKTSLAEKKNDCQELKAPYIKIEVLEGYYSPLFKEFKQWPELHLNETSKFSPFVAITRNKIYDKSYELNTCKRMIKKNAHVNISQRIGFCEMCSMNYTSLRQHVISEKHRRFATNDLNFEQIDKSIQNGLSLNSMINSLQIEKHINNKCEHKNIQKCQCPNNKIESSRITRSAHKKLFTNKILGSCEYESGNMNDSLLNSSKCIKKSLSKNHTYELYNKRRRTADHKFLEENESYYHVQILGSKLRSTDQHLRQCKPWTEGKENINDNHNKEETTMTVRTGELSKEMIKADNENIISCDPKITNSCAFNKDFNANHVNYMTTKNELPNISFENPNDIINNSLIFQSQECTKKITGRRIKRTHTQIFLEDNRNYYKFDTSKSRLRATSHLQNSPQNFAAYDLESKSVKTLCSSSLPNSSSASEQSVSIPSETIAKKSKFINEYHHTDNFKKVNTGLESNSEYESKLFDINKIQDNEFPKLTHGGLDMMNFSFELDSSSDMYNVPSNFTNLISEDIEKPFKLPYELPIEVLLSKHFQNLRLYKKSQTKSSVCKDFPRKSPRCHASTLAMLSQWFPRKKRSISQILPQEDFSKSNRIIESSMQRLCNETVCQKCIGSTYTFPSTFDAVSISHCDLEPTDTVSINQDNFINVALSFDKCSCCDLNDECNLNEEICTESKKKKKLNKTGWPKKRGRPRKICVYEIAKYAAQVNKNPIKGSVTKKYKKHSINVIRKKNLRKWPHTYNSRIANVGKRN